MYNLSTIEETHIKYVLIKGKLTKAKDEILSTMGVQHFVFFHKSDPINEKINRGENITFKDRQKETVYGFWEYPQPPHFILIDGFKPIPESIINKFK